MKNFIDVLNRLKLALGVSMDSEVADFLEMKQSAFAGRKKRNSFPDEQLRLIAVKHSDLNLDVDYILTGDSERRKQKQLVQDEYLRKSYEYEQSKRAEKQKNITLSILPEPNNANIAVELTEQELKLISNFRKSDDDGQRIILEVSQLARQSLKSQS